MNHASGTVTPLDPGLIQAGDAIGQRARAIPARSPVDPGAPEDLPDRGPRHRDAEPRELAVDPPASPRLVLPGQPGMCRTRGRAASSQQPAASSQRSIRPGGTGFRHPQFQNCHRAAVFRPGTEAAYQQFITARAQILNQRPELVDC